MNICTCMCVCVHSLSVGNVRAMKQKPSPGFCLAGRFMQLSVLGKGWGASLDFQCFRNLCFGTHDRLLFLLAISNGFLCI